MEAREFLPHNNALHFDFVDNGFLEKDLNDIIVCIKLKNHESVYALSKLEGIRIPLMKILIRCWAGIASQV